MNNIFLAPLEILGVLVCGKAQIILLGGIISCLFLMHHSSQASEAQHTIGEDKYFTDYNKAQVIENSGSAQKFSWKGIPGRAETTSYNALNRTARSGLNKDQWGERSEYESRFEPLPLTVSIIILGAIALAIINTSTNVGD